MFCYSTTTHSHIPELAPCDYHLFGKLKDPFAGRAREVPRPTSQLLASPSPHAEAEVDDHPTRMEISCG
ncbi:hypothetical protein ANN_13377 [Periplaneta americana]|uniref:Uncharacterized protein n=1 Tax=Periplaneta americana TaxID=6978 RepID=A0ABQ8TJE7_PERAM|nr:hypothetical protein ANN_13377 [Periplaneta americana]